MSTVCEGCGEHPVDCFCDLDDLEYLELMREKNMVEIEEHDLIDLIHWARRYCDARATYAPSAFNNVYERIKIKTPELLTSQDQFDCTLKDKGIHWPYAQDGMYNSETGAFDARK